MKITYQQLAQEQRYQIQAFLAPGLPQAGITRQLSWHHSTIYRELARSPDLSYLAMSAQATSEKRRRTAAKYSRDTSTARRLFCRGLKRYFSPEMLTHRMHLEGTEDSV